MSVTECEEAALALMFIYQDETAREAMRELRLRHAEPAEYVEALASFANPEVAPTIRREFLELPALTISVIMEAWHLADSNGKPFEVVSVRPERAIEFARTRRVRVAVEAESDVARVLISHVPTRHAAWYTPVSA
jgi:hypothetical protein